MTEFSRPAVFLLIPPSSLPPAKLTDMGTYGAGDEDEDVTFDDLVDDYDDEDEAIEAVS